MTIKNMFAAIFISILVTAFFMYIFVHKKSAGNLMSEMMARDEMIKIKEKKIDELSKRLSVMDDYFAKISLKDLLTAVKDQEEKIQKYKKEKEYYESIIKELKTNVSSTEEKLTSRVNFYKKELEDLKLVHENKIKQDEQALKIKEEKFNEFLSKNIVLNLTNIYREKDRDFTNLVLRVQMLKALCEYSDDAMEFKEAMYVSLFKEIKKGFPESQFIRDLKVVNTNKDIALQMNGLIKYFNSMYLKN